MALLLKNGAVFLHIPKTGGKWVTNVLEEMNLVRCKIASKQKHLDIDHFFAYRSCNCWQKATQPLVRKCGIEPKRKKPYLFCFVRNPLSWYESWFRYMEQPSRNWQKWGDEYGASHWHPCALLNGTKSNHFNHFIQNAIQKRPGFVTEMYGWYTKPQMDFIGKQETLVDDLIRVLDVMNIKYDEDLIRNYKKIGVSPSPANAVVWDDKLKKEVLALEYAGMVRYGYATEQSTMQNASQLACSEPRSSQ